MESRNNNHLSTSTFTQSNEYNTQRTKKSKLSNLFVNSKKNLLTNQPSKENLLTSSNSTKDRHSLNRSNSSTIEKNRLNTTANQYSIEKSNDNLLDEMRLSVRNLRVRKIGLVEPSEEEIVYRWLEKVCIYYILYNIENNLIFF